MWPFKTVKQLTNTEWARLEALERRLDAAAGTLTTLQAHVKSWEEATSTRLDELAAALNKVRGKVYGELAAVQRGERTVPTKTVDTMTREELRRHVGIVPGKPFPHKP